MVNKSCKLIVEGTRGLMTFDKKKAVFLHRNCPYDVEIGLGEIERDSYTDKGNYAFANFRNIFSRVPQKYYDIEFFENRGVPLKVYKGKYGKSIFLKEDYKNKSFIKAYCTDGNILLYENKMLRNKNFNGLNMYYCRLDNFVGVWEDVTDGLAKGLKESLEAKKCSVDIINSFMFLGATKNLKITKVVRLFNGAVIVDGNYESLAFWSKGNEIKMAWLGRKETFSGSEDVLKEVEDKLF